MHRAKKKAIVYSQPKAELMKPEGPKRHKSEHFSYYKRKGKFPVVDLRGWNPGGGASIGRQEKNLHRLEKRWPYP